MDVFFGINFVMDLFVLWMEGGILGLKRSGGRLLAGAFVPAVLACAAAWLTKGVFAGNTKGVWFAAALLGQIVSSGIGYGFDGVRQVLKRTGLLCALGFLSAGCFVWIYSYTGFGAWMAERLPDGLKAGSIVACGIIFAGGGILAYAGARRLSNAGMDSLGLSGGGLPCGCLEAELTFLGRRIRAAGLVDTGNGLVDPISGTPVIIADKELAEEWIILAKESHPERFRVIPYHSVGVEKGLLEAVVLDEIVLYRAEGTVRRSRAVLASAAGSVGTSGTYRIILHPSIMQAAKAAE
ncbi:MAG: sigma-E processing peptidase SpoIIGA [Lachnospiraceae bacterium]|nr:sigma-E processing peptidase SpoIIGA [Lachnospiraceae bacterium]